MDQGFSSDRLAAEYDNLFSWVSQRLSILGYDNSTWSGDPANKQAILDFISGDGFKTLSVFPSPKEKDVSLRCDMADMNAPPSGMKAYFIRSSQNVLTIDSIQKCVMYGTVSGSGLTISSLERFMKGLVEKQISSNNELSWHYHRFMATLTDAIHASDNRTVLYCPNFDYKSLVDVSQDKDRLQIMESIVIHWTRQIKDVVNNHENSMSAETSGPLDEIEFWKGRAEDLFGIQKQLEVNAVSRIIEVLEYAKSNYINPFRNRTQEIVARAAEANDNLKFLETIREQCTDLRTIDADKIVSILPDLLNRIRLIWTYSSYYSNNDHISGILRKISNEIIRRFRTHVPVHRVMKGDIDFSVARLLEAIDCGTQWKNLYHQTASAIDRQKSRYNRVWNMDDASIFAQIDAFVQRCRDLIDVCESQVQFTRKTSSSSKATLPKFGGTKAQEIVDGILGIQSSFEMSIDRLNKLDYDILDVRISKWHDDYHNFKKSVKDLEVMFTNVINAAFDNNATVSDGVVLTETFYSLAKREVIVRCVERKAAEVLQLFLKQIQISRSEFELSRLNPPLRLQEPQYAGSALWAQSLATLVKESYTMIVRLTGILNPRDFEESSEAYTTLLTVIKEFKISRYNIWLDDLTEKAKDNGLHLRLEKPLLRRLDTSDTTSKTGTEILSNFDEVLLAVFAEVAHWEKFHGEFTIPYIAHDICIKRESLRVMRESVLLLVRAYNDIVHEVSADERRLFIDHIRKLDRKIAPGLTKITWQSRNMIEIYVRECCNSCHDLMTMIKEFKDGRSTIQRICKQINNTLLVRIDKNQVYEGDAFEAKQRDFRTGIYNQFENHYNKIASILKTSYRNFKDGPTEVHREWKSQVIQIDKLVEQSLKYAVKRSLQELSKAIIGDAKTDPLTLFTVQISLDSSKVLYTPSMVNLSHSLNIVAKEVILLVTAIHRIRGLMFDSNAQVVANAHVSNNNTDTAATNSSANLPGVGSAPTLNLGGADDKIKSYYDIISDDADILRLVVQIMNGMSSTASELQKYLTYWDKYKTLWEMDKEGYIKKYSKSGKSPSQFDSEITRFRSQQSEIYGETSTYVINFVRVDCNALKDNLISHCLTIQNKLTSLLNQNGLAELKDIYETFKQTKENLTTAPVNLDELSSKITLCKDFKDQLPSIQARFDPVREIYTTLEKFEVALKEDEVVMLLGLDNVFDEFTLTLIDAEKLLDRSKVTMKRDLEVQMDNYSAQMVELKSQAFLELPYDNAVYKDPKDALEIIELFKSRIAKAKERESSLTTGLSIFGIPSNEHKDLTTVVKDVDFMHQIWTITLEWNQNWNNWKTGQFNDLNVEAMELEIGNYSKKVAKLGRDIKKWKVWETMKEELDRFKETIPLVQDLRNKAMRSRHWISLQDRVGVEFDHESPDFTLNEVMKLKLNLHKDFISELSSNANKELAIEVALNDLEARWSQVQLDLGPYKEKYFKLKSADDITQILEDDSVALSTMKASKFYASFAYRIDDWEHSLAVISEVVESVLAVQRKWIYLESIFNSGGDISKQLPSESALFRSIDDDFLTIMTTFSLNTIAKQCCLQEGLLDKISSMDERLERIQKSLDQYLEKKRMIFPRFYFVSDDDLLEILGQSKDPSAVQKHIKKCFEGIKTLKLITPSSGTGAPARGSVMQASCEATQMNSHDGEVAPFVENIAIDGPVELWLVQVEKAMRRGIGKLLSQSLVAFKGKKEKWVKDTIGQLLITTGAIMWTADCNRALLSIASGTKAAMRQQKKRQVSYLNKLTSMIRTQLSKIERNKVVALITMEIHNRDVIERMVKANCSSVSDFDWLSQLRFVYYKDASEFGKCEVKQLNSLLEYSYEYQGNNGRLVVTPLTDRCVLTLITAMYLNRGGNPLGPAGTGKTETVKDLGKNLAKYVVVINCSDGMDYKSVGRIFSGLVQSGSWGCFDEFNRIKIEVISVVAMQILSILNALSAKVPQFSFMGTTIPCNPNCGIFITMNPGYAGRTELPDNLKALMRPVAMMAPDLTMIAEVMLASEGFNEARIMAKKTVTLYSLMTQQLSKQDHYDYGLRNLKAVLNMAGQLKRSDANMTEEAILMRALRDMNLPKFIKDDERLFRLLLGDLFPSLELAVSEYGTLRSALEAEFDKANLQKHEFLMQKIFQFYDSRLTRHCNMLVGDPLGGKSTAWKMLAAAQTSLSKQGVEGYLSVTPYIISPKSIELDELYGAYDLSTFEWKDGILSTIFKSCSEDEKQYEKWILFDGPIDAMWIESMNSVMDDNKILTLINGDRIPLSNTMSLVFETQDLRVASPATVSRAGMIYIDASELGWRTFTESWLKTTYPEEDQRTFYRDLFEKWLPRLLKFKELNCVEPVKVSDFCAVTNLCTLFDTICKQETSFTREVLGNDYNSVAEKLFIFAITWSIGAAVDEAGRKKISVCMTDIDSIGPVANTMFDFFVDVSKNDFFSWESKVPNWRPLKGSSFHDMIVPTVDTTRNSYIAESLLKVKKNTMFVGATGTGKTILAQTLLKDLPDNYHQLSINFSAATTSAAIQDIIEASMEKRSKDKLGPVGGKNLVIFIDDFNMPKLTSRESPFQPPLELIRMWLDYQGWYDRSKCTWKYILDSQLIVAMGHPGGGRNQICQRTQSRFALMNFTFPSDSQIVRIFESILSSKFSEYENDIKQLSSGIAIATLNTYKAVCADFLPTPEKFHYQFNIRDVAKVIQGILLSSRKTIYTPEGMLRLWIHESQRVYADRFIRAKNCNDEQKFRDILSAKMSESLQKDWNAIAGDCIDPKVGPMFCGYLQENYDDHGHEILVYEEVSDYKKVRTCVEEKLEDYNNEPKLISMNLAMFKDAVKHVSRIHRVLTLARGNLMLIGVGGSGRSSLARLGAYIAKMSVFTIEITKNYRLLEFREDIKKLYLSCGCDDKKIVFLFNDTQVKDEGFLEDINNLLSSGLVPNLFQKDEYAAIYDGVRKAAVTAGIEDTPMRLWEFFIDRVRSNLHVVLAMSPIGDQLRNRCRMYPGFVNCTTIDYFHVWPAEALQEVAMKFLSQVEFSDSSFRPKIATVFADMHMSVISASSKMLVEHRRHNYVTPMNYLELVKGYRTLLGEKRQELGSSVNKLANGLAKLEDAKTQVETLSKELELKKVVVAQSQKDCEDLLVQIVSERRVADEQRRHVEADSERISQETIECKAISDDAEADLAVALPALEHAMEEVDKLDNRSVSEVKAYTKPPVLVETVMQAVMIFFNRQPDWATAKKTLSEANFIQQIKGFDKDNISQSTTNKIRKYIENPQFKPEEVRKVSGAASALCSWVHAIFMYASVAREVAPKRQRLKEATESLAIKQAALKDAQDALAIVTAKLASLQVQYDNSVNEKNRLRDEADGLEAKLDRADKLVKGLSGEYTRWQSTIGELNASLVKVIGDSLLAAAFLSYAGPFETSYRSSLLKSWMHYVSQQKIPVTDNFDFIKFLAKPTDVRDWNIQGLPKDDFSTENGVISTRGGRWPLMIDPQGQANRWIRNKEGAKLKIIDLKMNGYLREIENAVQYGLPVLLQDVLEDIDPALEPVLAKSILKVGNRSVIRIGDKELDYSPDFKLYITTKLANPHYTPEISTKATVVNFAVKKDGLEAQLLGIVVLKEEEKLETQKSELTITVARGKRQLVDLEDEILRLLNESKGSLLDDEFLVNTLQKSKVTAEEVTHQLVIAEETEKKIDIARSGYRSAAVRAALAYFVLDDMSRVDPMYQFSLDSYISLFKLSIDNSKTSSLDIPVAKRCEDINTYHTLAVYKYTCRGLFEAHKLLFSLQLCFKIMESQNNLNPEEFAFFSLGPSTNPSEGKTTQRGNPGQDWLPALAWDTICELDKLPNLQGIATSFEQLSREWKVWYMSSKPEQDVMPGDWSIKSTELQKLCILRSLRMDRVLFGATKFIASNIGQEFVDPPSFDLKAVYETSTCKTPLIFVLSPGVDPTSGIFQLASQLGQTVENCALGQGQAPTAVRMIEEGIKRGNWVFLANCHLMLSWMPTLEKMIESMLVEGTPHPKFRLWLSSSPDPNFPISILQNGIKMTTEPPKGLRANLLTIYNTISEDQFARCSQQSSYKRLLFALSWFHAILLERKKFKSLGFNIPYDFNESDFAICHDLIIAFLDEYPDRIPFDAMKYLIAEANYGGRVTDDWDRRLVNVYIGELFCDECIDAEKFMLSTLPEYYIPEEGSLVHYKNYIRGLPQADHPLAFGQHVNSDMAASIEDANSLIRTLTSLQPRAAKAVDEDAVDPLAAQCADLLEQTPELFDLREIKERVDLRSDPDPLKTVLYQELDRYNRLLSQMRRTLSAIVKVTQGTVSVTSELEDVMMSLSLRQVPRLWGSTYPSLKALGPWMKDLIRRIEFFASWAENQLPSSWWLSAMTYPTGFLTAVLQVSARLNGVSIDSLSYETIMLTSGERSSITAPPKDGVYVYGISLEGATWNFPGGFLEESRPMELVSAMPIIHFKPIEGRRRAPRGFYSCPLYMYPVRSGSRERPSYVVTVDLKSGKFSADFWTKRGVAMLLSTSI